ncbi:adenosylcobalamin-dependent ribonucleoside-diphosphate reductase [Paraburkholderia tropica]|uniref:Vitamin B12-dependent ribonucleotide reductase n=2 Tax=Burkholderiaceae TaxID=119060 RepID=A0AAQ1GLD1_9BURK|nr:MULTISPECIES: adenosylcobalamin-dependent ribonucleoside-diphosphate reductase [Paraburkholderia]QNB13634.1 adenosylcobalamin-dependent ribonucleoside-diphosphate reductase [Paraburkholderia tropica]RQM47210.1 adenosylcobalamin-dependent ribonucleoside-diphosphate reductase [Paraburkholderia bannensis]RQN36910.1 adenosylcobalamin-dependent ribonucleoside-diphosphate reductase [Paraburkholderia tropica]SEK10736.1 ribonucleoside-diphosphate reductase class II [Paraburkholderia tropica]
MAENTPPLSRAGRPAPQPFSLDVMLEKYAKGDEQSADDIYRRVARGVAQAEPPALRAEIEARFLDNLRNGALGAGRIMSAAGTAIESTLINCFVQPVGDSIQDTDDEGRPGIYVALLQAAETMRRGGGVGYNFSAIRPRGALVKSTGSSASGPCSYIDVFDASCRTVESAGSRRGAQMAVLDCDHPDLPEFIEAKHSKGRWNNFNVSVAVTDAFMRAVENDDVWQLVHRAAPSPALRAAGDLKQRDDGLWVYAEKRARALWDTIMRSTYDMAEPGVVFISRMNEDNNLRAQETIRATNPCGEQPLPPYGCCNLGPLDLTRFVKAPFAQLRGAKHASASAADHNFDWDALAARTATQVRFLDDVLDVTLWPLPEQQAEAAAKRRIGVGFTGLGDTLVMLGIRYNTEEGCAFGARVARTMRDAAYRASVELARERGAFALFDANTYLAPGTFASRLPDTLQDEIRAHGIRNSHLLSIAPTGTVSLAFADNVSNGVEPAFSWTYQRTRRMADGGSETFAVEDHAWRVYRELVGETGDMNALPDYFVSALQMSAQDHVQMMAAVQPYVDTSISKTVNVPADYPFEDFENLYLDAWRRGLKGLATYRPNETLGAVLHVTPATTETPDDAQSDALHDPLRVAIDHRPRGELPAVIEKIEYLTQTGKVSLYVAVSFLEVTGQVGGEPVTIERPIEFFIPVGQRDESQQWITATMRSLSLAARGGFVARNLQDLRKVSWDRGQVRYGETQRLDGKRTPLWHDSEVAAIAYAIQQILHRRGFLDAEGRQVPTRLLAQRRAEARLASPPASGAEGNDAAARAGDQVLDGPNALPADASLAAPHAMLGRKCGSCGANAVIRRDGCDFCTACGEIGTCG